MEKLILDVTCGDRTIWFQKNEPHTIYCDIRREEWEGDFGKVLNSDGKQKHRHLVIDPDIQCSFTNLPFADNTFNLVVFDPPHIENLAESSWLRKSYGSLDGNWKPMIKKGFDECMRVLCLGGVLIFKWSDISISTRDIIKIICHEPLFGHRSGKKMNTHWMAFMKFDGNRHLKEGVWIDRRINGTWVEQYCSECGVVIEDEPKNYNFCPNCGADMRDHDEDE